MKLVLEKAASAWIEKRAVLDNLDEIMHGPAQLCIGWRFHLMSSL